MENPLEDLRPYVLIRVGEGGVELVSLSAHTAKLEAKALRLYSELHHVVREIDRIINSSKRSRLQG